MGNGVSKLVSSEMSVFVNERDADHDRCALERRNWAMAMTMEPYDPERSGAKAIQNASDSSTVIISGGSFARPNHLQHDCSASERYCRRYVQAFCD